MPQYNTPPPPTDTAESENLRATFIHPDGRTHRTCYGCCHVAQDGSASVAVAESPQWIEKNGVEVVIADRDGDVRAAFTVARVRQDAHAFELIPRMIA